MVGSAVPAIPAGAALGGGIMEERDVHLLAVGAGIARPHWVREPSVRASSSARRPILRRSSRSDAAAQRLGFGRPNEGLNAHGMFAGQRPSCAATCTANGPGPVAPPRSGPAVSIVVSDASSAMVVSDAETVHRGGVPDRLLASSCGNLVFLCESSPPHLADSTSGFLVCVRAGTGGSASFT